jgi:hypothetical protein
MSASRVSAPQLKPGSTAKWKRRRQAVLISLGAVALIALQLVVYVPVIDYPSPFFTTGFILGCGPIPTLEFTSVPRFPPFARVTVFWSVNGSAKIPLTFYVDQLTISQSGPVTTYTGGPVTSWNGSTGSGTFESNGGMYYFGGVYHPKTPVPFGQCPDYTLEVTGFYFG